MLMRAISVRTLMTKWFGKRKIVPWIEQNERYGQWAENAVAVSYRPMLGLIFLAAAMSASAPATSPFCFLARLRLCKAPA
jgi:hypothetical protein